MINILLKGCLKRQSTYKKEREGIMTYLNGNMYNISELANLQNLGFTQQEIQAFLILNQMGNGNIKSNLAAQMNLTPQQIQRLRYMKNIITGRVYLETTDDLSKHLRKMFGQRVRIGISNLPFSKVQNIHRKALIAGLPEKSPFSVYNSNYKKERYGLHLYDVVSVRRDNMKIITSRRPILKYGQKPKVEGVLHVTALEPRQRKLYELVISNKYARLCNRFAVVASLRRPEFHLGMFEILCLEGTKVYVYATHLGTGKNVGLRGGMQRVYYAGSLKEEIPFRVKEATQMVYQYICGVYMTEHPSTADYEILPKIKTDEVEYDEE